MKDRAPLEYSQNWLLGWHEGLKLSMPCRYTRCDYIQPVWLTRSSVVGFRVYGCVHTLKSWQICCRKDDICCRIADEYSKAKFKCINEIRVAYSNRLPVNMLCIICMHNSQNYLLCARVTCSYTVNITLTFQAYLENATKPLLLFTLWATHFQLRIELTNQLSKFSFSRNFHVLLSW